MKLRSSGPNVMVFSCVLVLALLVPYLLWGHMKSRVAVQFDNTGLTSLSYKGTNLLKFGDPRVLRVVMRNSSGATFPADLQSILRANKAKREMTRNFLWGTVVTHYEAKDNRFLLTITTTNKSESTIEEITYEPLGLVFPG